jgi:HSP20 family protein
MIFYVHVRRKAMSLITRHPLGLFNELQRDMNRLFDNRLFPGTQNLIANADFLPSVDIHEDKDAYVIAVDLPGMKPEDIHVSSHDGLLSISGKRESVHEDKEQKRSERVFGSFLREFSMPENADLERIEANSKDGVLELRVPKSVKPQPKRIEVKVQS